MKNKRWMAVLLTAGLILGGCSSPAQSEDTETAAKTAEETTAETQSQNETEVSENQEQHAEDAQDHAQTITGDFTITSDNESGITQDGSTYTITQEGEYTLTGCLEDGQIIVDAPEDAKVTLILSGVSLTCSDNSAIYVKQADEVKIKAEKDTYNEVLDTRSLKSDSAEEEDDDTGSSAIYSKADLKLTGKGYLYVEAGYDNGICSTKDLSVKNVTLKVNAPNNALKGKDSVTIEDGNLILISTGGDGIRTTDSDVSSKGNQRGTVTVSGGITDIYAACDGIDAAYDAVVEGEDTVLNIYTADYSEYTGDVVASSTEDFYLIVPMSDYSEDTDYYAYYYNNDSDEGKWVQAVYYTMVSSGRQTQYYGLKADAPSGYTNVAFYTFNAGDTPSVDSYMAVSDGDTINSSMNGYLFSEVSDGVISGDWVSLSTNGGGGNQDKSTWSSKGIKADNSVQITGGSVTISSEDDAVHANSDVVLENGENGAGTVSITGGSLVLTAADDGIHGDTSVTISGGYISIPESYEGIEGNLVTIEGGSVYVYASDDGINACSGNETPLVTVSGGYLEVTTPSGDTDAIDSNGNYVQTGGTAVVKGGAGTGQMAGSIDVDGSISVTGGTVAAIGGICETPEDSVNGYVMSGTSFDAGDYVLTDGDGQTVLEFTLDSGYSNGWISSESLETGKTYTLTKDGTEVASWTQEDGTMGASSSGGFGGQMPGGFGGRK